jgi:uncharacterized protein (DUF2336 family)
MSADEFDFETAKSVARDGSEAERAALAARADTAPELLYFLAQDSAASVRRAIAENPSTPRQADLMLSQDRDIGVRCLLARKIVGQGLGEDERSQLWRMGFTILETLMRDQVVRVRRALADAIKTMFAAPHDVVSGLAHDADARVAAPILRHSPVLTDDDLVEIVEAGAPDWAHQAIAARESVSERVSAALVDAGAAPTVTRLLRNRAADIGEAELERIVDRAPPIEAWHEPLVKRPSLPARLAERIGGFVSGPLRALLPGAKAARNGVDWNDADGAGKPGWSPRATGPNGARESAKDRARRLHAEGKLNDAVIEMAFNANEREFVLAALALRAGLPLWGVERIVKGATGKGMTALCWKASLQMRFAIELQRRLAKVPPSKVVLARDGFDYPYTDDEMESRLDLLLA